MDADEANWLLFLGAGAIAFYGLSYRDALGVRPWVHLLIGGIALMFSLRALFAGILALW